MTALRMDVTKIGDAVLDEEALSAHLEEHVQHCREMRLAKERAEKRCEMMEHQRKVVISMGRIEARSLGEKVIATQDDIARISTPYLEFLKDLDRAMEERALARAEHAAAEDAQFAAKDMLKAMLNNCATIRSATSRLAPT